VTRDLGRASRKSEASRRGQIETKRRRKLPLEGDDVGRAWGLGPVQRPKIIRNVDQELRAVGNAETGPSVRFVKKILSGTNGPIDAVLRLYPPRETTRLELVTSGGSVAMSSAVVGQLSAPQAARSQPAVPQEHPAAEKEAKLGL
jgi:hypothetical protein